MVEKKIIEKIEREYVIPLRSQVMKVPRYKRAKKAVRTIREFLVQHMQIRDRDLKKIRLDKYLNQMIWSRGIQSPPHKIKVKAIKEGDMVRVEAYELSKKVNFQKQREERRDEKYSENPDKKKSKGSESVKKKEDEEVKTEELQKEVEEKEKKKTTIEAEQKYEKKIAKARKHEGGMNKRPIQTKKEHSKGAGTGR